MKLTFARIETSAGRFLAVFTTAGLARLEFPPTAPAVGEGRARPDAARDGEELSATQRRWLRQTQQALEATLAGRAVKSMPPLDLAAGTAFQQSVWRALQAIAPGDTRTYGQIARTIGRPQAVRAVGGACGANPIPVLIPCHRVLAAGGGLGGFSGGLDWKRQLLTREGGSIKGLVVSPHDRKAPVR